MISVFVSVNVWDREKVYYKIQRAEEIRLLDPGFWLSIVSRMGGGTVYFSVRVCLSFFLSICPSVCLCIGLCACLAKLIV